MAPKYKKKSSKAKPTPIANGGRQAEELNPQRNGQNFLNGPTNDMFSETPSPFSSLDWAAEDPLPLILTWRVL